MKMLLTNKIFLSLKTCEAKRINSEGRKINKPRKRGTMIWSISYKGLQASRSIGNRFQREIIYGNVKIVIERGKLRESLKLFGLIDF